MFLKSSFLLLLFVAFLWSEEDTIHFLSKEVFLTEENSVAKKDATLIIGNRYMRAERIVYSQDEKALELFGDVTLVENGMYYFLGNYAKIDMDGNEFYIEDMFLYHKPRHIWLYANEANASGEKYFLKDTFLSSCRSENPDWGFYINEGYFYKKEQLFELYNTVLYASDIPILYFPYINFSINRERKSGLLVPRFGVSGTDGVFISQPIYYVPNNYSDWEFAPQTRTLRGNGFYATYRYTHSKYSKGAVTFGYFKERDKYLEEYEMAHKEHYGLEVMYKNTNLSDEYRSGLYLNLRYLNDIDYLYLKPVYEDGETETTNLIESRVNYYMSKGQHSFGFYNNYTIDTSKNSNGETLQTLPHLQYHKSINSVSPFILYSMDYNFKNLYRTTGTIATQHEGTIPIVFHASFFNEYLRVRLTENFYGSYINFDKTQQYRNEENFYLRHYHQLEIFSDLSRKYDETFHSTNFGLNIVVPDFEYKSGFYSPEENDEEVSCEVGQPCEFQTEDRIEGILEAKFTQYIHFNKSGAELLYHKMTQPINFVDGKFHEFGEFENEVRWQITKKLSLYNSIIYSHSRDLFEQVSSTLELVGDRFTFDISHFYKNELLEERMQFVSNNLAVKVGEKSEVFGHYSYDIEKDSTRSWGGGYSMKKRCWNYKVSYRQEYHPILTTTGTATIRDDMVYFLIELYPLGGFEYEFK
jgi:LPS-assembly protein